MVNIVTKLINEDILKIALHVWLCLFKPHIIGVCKRIQTGVPMQIMAPDIHNIEEYVEEWLIHFSWAITGCI